MLTHRFCPRFLVVLARGKDCTGQGLSRLLAISDEVNTPAGMPANLASLRDEARQLRETANYFSVHSDGTDATTTKIRSLNDRSADMLKRFLEKNSGRLSVEEEKSLKDDIAEGACVKCLCARLTDCLVKPSAQTFPAPRMP